MAKRRSSASASFPRKKARLDLPTDTPSLEISADEGASLLSASTSTSSPPSPSRREKRKRTDSDPTDGSLEESDPGTSAKRARTQSPAGETEHLRKPGFEPWPEWQDDPDFVPWPSAFDDPQSEAHIVYEDEHYTKELTAEAREFRKQGTLALQGYLLCECGKYHQMDGRKPWHYPGMEPELDESDAERAQSRPGRNREPFPSPEISENEEADATGGDQLEITHVGASVSPAPVISEASNVSPTNSPATSPISSSTTTEAQVSRQRSNTKRSAGKPASQRQTRKNNKRKLERGNADKGDKRQPRSRKSKTTSTIEEPVQSRRSSRRAAGSQLWFLDNNGEACLVASSSR